MVRKLLGFLFTLIFTTSVAVGQSQLGRLQGTVTDEKTGEPVIGVNVTINVSGSTKGSVTSDGGEYEIAAIPPGKYDVTYSDVRYGRKILKDVEIGEGRTTVKDVALSSDEKTLDIVDVEAHRGLFKKDKTTGSRNIDSETISKMPTKSINDVVSLNTNISTKAGGLSIQGQRSEGTVIKIDGVRVRNLRSVPQRSIQSINTITSGIPAKHGDATGGVISITTKGASPTYNGSIELLSSQFLDGYGFNEVEGNVSGPIYKQYKGTDSSTTKIGFQFGGAITYQDENRPTVEDYQVVKDDALERLRERPLVRDPTAEGFRRNASFITDDDIKNVSNRPNVDRFNTNMTGKLTYNVSEQIDLIAGGQFGYVDRPDFNRTDAMFNYNNYPQFEETSWRTYLRLTQSFANDKDQSGISNVFYSIQLAYSEDDRKIANDKFGDDHFKYGYYGEYDRKRAPNYQFETDSVNGVEEEAFFQQGFRDTAVDFTPAAINDVPSNYTEQLYDFTDGDVQTLQDIAGQGGLRNGDAPQFVYNLWNNVGNTPGSYFQDERQTFRASADGSFDIGEHTISLGVQYEQIVRRAYSLASRSLWTIGRQSVNSHIRQLDTDNPQPVFRDGTFTDTVRFQRLEAGEQTTFDKRLREQEDIGPKEFINIDEYRPEDLSIGLFGADELLNQASVTYFGYDHKGNETSGDPSIQDFLNNPTSRPMGAYNPNYTSGYIQDKFQVKDLFFRVGVRVDRFDANQVVPKDIYSLFPTKKVGGVEGERNPAGEHPGNLSDQAVVYVDDAFATDPDIVGYREGDNWFNASGESVQNPNTIALQTRSGEIEPFLADGVDEDANLDPAGFEEYEPQVTVMPRISFSFPISQEARFQASYDVLTQRPKNRIQTTLDDFYYLENRSNQTINNPNLQPERSNKFTLGFKQRLTRKSSLELKGFYTETRNLIQQQQINQAYPSSYRTYRNIDFATTKGLTAIYDIRSTKRSPVSFKASYTLQFADGTGSNENQQASLIEAGQPNLRTPFPLSTDVRHNFQGILDYRFRSGANYNGPVTGNGTQLLKNVGINLRLSAQSGQPYSAQSNVTQAVSIGIRQRGLLDGDINGARLPWTYTANLRIDKRIPVNWGGKDDKSGRAARGGGPQDNINIYLRIDNLLNTRNVQSVYDYTGSADDDGFLTSAQGQQAISEALSQQAFRDQYRAKVTNPFNYGRPRIIRLGARFNF